MRKILLVLSAAFISTSAVADGVSLKDKLACTPDAIRFCVHLKPLKHEPGIINHVIACLQQHRNELKPKCDAVFTKHGM